MDVRVISSVVGLGLFLLFSNTLQAADPIEFKVLSYNIHGLPAPLATGWRYKAIGEVLAKRRAEGTAPEIVLIQEAWQLDKSKELIAAAGYPYVARGPAGTKQKLPSGLWILSEYPILKTEAVIYKNCVNFDCMARKSAFYAQIKVPGLKKPIDIYTTHLNAAVFTDNWLGWPRSWNVRKKQIVQMVDLIKKTHDPEAVLIAGGDFNMNAESAEYQLLVSLSQLSSTLSACAHPDSNCANQGNLPWETKNAIDIQFFAGESKEGLVFPLSYERTFKDKVNGVYLSDHSGLETLYRVQESTQ